jgi:heat-inducible transcriptional repressor
MTDLTDRQVQIIKAVVEEYTNTAEPVGSETMDKKYSLGVSPATIRNEMVYLTEQGYLAQPHTSAGRIPTTKAIRLYIDEIMREQDLSVAEEVSAKEKVWDKRHELGQLLREASNELARRTGSIGIALTDDGQVYKAGYAHVLDMPEFYDIDVTRTLFSLLDEVSSLSNLLNREVEEGQIQVLMGDDFGNQYLLPVTCVYTRFHAGGRAATLGVIGSLRFNYPRVIPLVRHFGALVSQIA